MSIKPTSFWLAVWLVFLCGSARVEGQYRLASREELAGPDMVRLPPTEETPDSPLFQTRPYDAPDPPEYVPSTPRPQIAVDLVNDGQEEVGRGAEAAAPAPSAMNQGFGPGYEYVGPQGESISGFARPTFEPDGDFLNWNSGRIDYLSPYMQQSGALHGFFFQYDHLAWSFNAPDVTVMGDTDTVRVVEDADLIDGRLHSANRFEFGHVDGEVGWLMSVHFGEGVRRMTGAGLSIVPGVVPNFGTLSMRDTFELSGAELNRTCRLSPNWEYFCGIRYVDFRENFGLQASGGLLPSMAVATTAKNQLIGPQVGTRFKTAAYKFILNVEGRFVPAYNYIRASQAGELYVSDGGPGPLLPTALYTLDKDDFSVVGEIRADAILPINRFAAFRLGYTGTLLGGIAYANPKVVYGGPGYFQMSDVATDDTVFVSAFTAGIEINR